MLDRFLEVLAAFLKFTLRPASAIFVVVALTVGVILTLSRRTFRTAPVYWLSFLIGYTLLATPAFAFWLASSTSGNYHQITRIPDAHGARTIVVLGGGSRTYRSGGQEYSILLSATVIRTMEGARLYRLLGAPTVIVSGGVSDSSSPDARPESELMRDLIVHLGVPSEHVLLESVATTTEGEASEVRRMLGDRRLEPIVIVTSPMHMRRSLAAFRAMGLNPFPGASAAWPDRSPDACRWCPDDDALKISEEVVYNQVAYLYYWARGWTAEP